VANVPVTELTIYLNCVILRFYKPFYHFSFNHCSNVCAIPFSLGDN